MENLTTNPNLSWIEDIMENFNFEAVHRYMVDTDWKWVTSTYPENRGIPFNNKQLKEEVPTLEKIKSVAKALLMNCEIGDTCFGGFVVDSNHKSLTFNRQHNGTIIEQYISTKQDRLTLTQDLDKLINTLINESIDYCHNQNPSRVNKELIKEKGYIISLLQALMLRHTDKPEDYNPI